VSEVFVSELVIYPVKSCAGISVREATLTRLGLAVDHVYDREWMVVTPEGQFLSQREHPRMALITPRLRFDTLELSAPGMLRLELELGLDADAPKTTVQLWDDRLLAWDCGDVAAEWFSQFLGARCRVVRSHPNANRELSTKWTDGVQESTMFADGYPILLIGQASLDDANDKLKAAGRDAIPMNRFRPNIVIAGSEAFEEDFADHIAIGAAQLKPVKPCPRCPIPSVDQATGIPGPDPLDILRGYRMNARLDDAICFGMNITVTAGAGQLLRVGDAATLELAF
jgi:uncharacterized protein YcbX